MTESLWKVVDLIKIFHSHEIVDTQQILLLTET